MEWANITFGAFLGVAGTFAVLSFALVPLIRRPYLLWIVARLLSFCVMAVALFPVALPAGFPEGAVRTALGDMALAMAIGCTGPFLANYMSQRQSLDTQRIWLRSLFPIAILTATATALSLQWNWFAVIEDVLLLLMMGILLVVLIVANRAGSRAARFQAIGWGPLIGVGITALVYEFVTGSPLPYWPIAALLAVLIDVVVTGVGVIDGFQIIKRQRDRARADMRKARRASVTDPLTDIANRRGLAVRFDNQTHRRPQGLAVLDCDHFKRINDMFGHDVGDRVLIAVVAGLHDHNAFPARQGGEEFVVLLYGADWQRLAETIRRRITVAVLERVPQVPFAVTASAGLTEIRADDALEDAIKRADLALYAAKRGGRDRLCMESGGRTHGLPFLQGVA